MKNNNLNKEIKASFTKFDENNTNLYIIKENIKNVNQIEKEVGKHGVFSLKTKLIMSFSAVSFFILGITLGLFIPSITSLDKEANVYLDVNPSVQIEVNSKNKVTSCIPLNEDGESVLYNLDLKNTTFYTAIYALVGSMYSNGFLNENNNSILVSVENYKNNSSIQLDKINEQIESIFENNESMNCSIIAQNIDNDKNVEELARAYGISKGKMKLILKIIEHSQIYTEENILELSSMSINELNLIYQNIFKDNQEQGNDVVSGKPNGFINEEMALNKVLESLKLTKNDLKWYDVFTIYHEFRNHERRMVYVVNLCREFENRIEKYFVDCNSGELFKEEGFEEWNDRIPPHKEDDDHDDEHEDVEEENLPYLPK